MLGEAGFQSIQSALDRGAWSSAEEQLRADLQVHPDNADEQYLLAMTLFREDKPKESLQTFTRAAQLRRPSGADFRYVALDYVLLNDFDDAQRWIARSVEENPGDGESWYAQGRIEYTNQNFPAALNSFRRALELMPHSVKVENNLGLTYEGLNQPDQALTAYRQAVSWASDTRQGDEQPLINLGIMLTDRGQFDEAQLVLQRAEQFVPGDSRVHGALGKLFTRRGQLPQAQKELELAIAAQPDDAALHFQLGQVYRREGMTEQATAELNRSAALERQRRR